MHQNDLDVSGPLVSIIIPFYNGERFIRETLRSVYSQTYQHVELIIVDDGSMSPFNLSDHSTDYDVRFTTRVIRQTNKGVACARILGLSQAHGDLVALLDQDDTWAPNFIEEILHYFDDPMCDVVFSNAYLQDARGQKIRKLYLDGRVKLYGVGSMPAAVVTVVKPVSFAWNFIISPSQALVRRSAVTSVPVHWQTVFGGADDWILWISLSAMGRGFVYHPDTLLSYRRHVGNASNLRSVMRDSEECALTLLGELLSPAQLKIFWREHHYRRAKDAAVLGRPHLAFRELVASVSFGVGSTSLHSIGIVLLTILLPAPVLDILRRIYSFSMRRGTSNL